MKLLLSNGNYIDTDVFHDLSRSVSVNSPNVQAWYLGLPEIAPVSSGDFIGSVSSGAPVNFHNVTFNPHGHGTHTECLGHITKVPHSVNKTMKSYFFEVDLISIDPIKSGEDLVITLEQLQKFEVTSPAVIIRTVMTDGYPTNYSGSNPAFFESKCAKFLLDHGVEHLLVDLPSVDKEEDGGKLAFHHAFWEVPESPNFSRTITELLAIPSMIPDGKYVLNLQVMPLENDAAPSRPLIFPIY